MDKLIIRPSTGIGNVRLGMNREEVLEAIGMCFYSTYDKHNLCDEYFNYNLRVYYNDKGIVNFIEDLYYISKYVQVIFEGIDVFKTKADELVSFIEKNCDKYNRNDSDSQFGYGYIFENIGLSLWRSNVFKEETMHEEWFQKLGPEEKEEELRFQYFEKVSVFGKGYYDIIQKGEGKL